jgi:glycosyltransferase involved in cell wall biosynthesis
MLIFVHVNNDYSGSSRVLHDVIKITKLEGRKVLLFVGSHGSGIFDEVDVEVIKYFTFRTSFKLLNLFFYFISQILLYIKLSFYLKRTRENRKVFYLNTLLPFGAAIYACHKKHDVIYHIHEVFIGSTILFSFLLYLAKKCGTKFIFVSNFLRDKLKFNISNSLVIHNSISPAFYENRAIYVQGSRNKDIFNVHMLCAFKEYKGVFDLIKIAEILKDQRTIFFNLIINEELTAYNKVLKNYFFPRNILVSPRVVDAGLIYSQSNLVLNLSRVDIALETFGLTLLEANSFGVPVIAPPVGGPIEIVKDGYNGYLIDSRRHSLIAEKILFLSKNHHICEELSRNCIEVSNKFSYDLFKESIQQNIL